VFSGMLGVTLFGIFLTPVFFYVIEGLTETPLFSSVRMRLVGKGMLTGVGLLTLGLPWWLPLLLGKGARTSPRLAGAPSVNGAAVNGAAVNGAATSNGHLAAANGQDEAHNGAVLPHSETPTPKESEGLGEGLSVGGR
jgi:hypothetical protein